VEDLFLYRESMDAAPDRVAQIQAEWRRERPDIDPSPQGVIGRLHRIGRLLDDRLDQVYARFDLSYAEFDILATLRRAGAPYQRRAGELADHTMVTSGGLTKRVDRLAARGLVSREPDPDDARGRVIRLTDAGHSLIETAFTAHMAGERRIIEELGTDAETLEPILRRWLGILEPQAASSR
jgi:DNA-binding MarR family transcriptional regulator